MSEIERKKTQTAMKLKNIMKLFNSEHIFSYQRIKFLICIMTLAVALSIALPAINAEAVVNNYHTDTGSGTYGGMTVNHTACADMTPGQVGILAQVASFPGAYACADYRINTNTTAGDVEGTWIFTTSYGSATDITGGTLYAYLRDRDGADGTMRFELGYVSGGAFTSFGFVDQLVASGQRQTFTINISGLSGQAPANSVLAMRVLEMNGQADRIYMGTADDPTGSIRFTVDEVTAVTDTTDPTSSITDPANGATLNSASLDPFTVSGSATDNVAVSSIEISVNGGGWQSATCTGCPGANVTWTYSWTLPADGSYAIQSRATDSSSNVETPAAGNTVTIDRTAPTVSSTVPTNGATGVTLDSNVTINWTENVDCATINTTNITSTSPGWTLSTCSGSQAVFTTSGQANSTLYNVNVTTAVTDANGNAMAAAVPFSYTTEAALDLTAPSSSVTSPADGAALNSASPDPFTVSGSATDNVAVSSIEVSINGGAWQAATCSGCPGASVTWTYSWTLPADGSYTIQSRATDFSSNVETPGAGNTVTIDRTAPAVSSTVPTNGTTGVTLNSSVTINWNENIDCATVNTSNITSDSPGWTLSSCSGAQAVFTTSGQVNSTTYNVNVTSAITDTAGNPMSSAVPFSYTTEAVADAVDPSSSVTSPADGGTLNSASPDPYTVSGSATDNVAVSSIQVSINGGAWQPATCSGCPGANVTWTYSWTLPADGSYTIQSRATDSSSNVETPGAGNTVTIDRTVPIVNSTVPTNGATGVALNSNVTINWNENVDCATVNTSNITSTSPGWTLSTCSNSQAVFTTSGQAGTTAYNFNVTTAVTDANGNAMAAPYPFSYTTADAGTPSSSITNPADGTTLNSASPDPYTVSGSASDNIAVSNIEISINGGAWQAVACTGCPGTNVTWTYSWTLPADGSYTLQSRATDSSSNVETPAAGNTVTIDRTAPIVNSTVPTFGATGVALNSNVTINWSENIDCATVNTSNITSTNPGWTLSTCSNSQAVFTTSGQAGNTTYNVNVTTAVTDSNSNAMAAAFPFFYTTADTGAPASSVTNPADGSTLNSASPDPFIVSGSATDNISVSNIEISINGGAWQAATCIGCPWANVTWTYSWTLPADGNYTIQSRATDSSSNVETPGAGNTVTIDRTAPTVSSTVPTNGATAATVNSNVTINWSENIDCGTVNTTNITSDSPGWTLSTCSGNLAVFTTAGQNFSTTYNVNITTAVTDSNGNAMTAAVPFSYTTDVFLTPDTVITAPLNSETLSVSPYSITGTATQGTDTLLRVEVSTDGGSIWNNATGTTSWTYSWTLPAENFIAHTIMARAVDINSVQDATPASVNINVDDVAPADATWGIITSGNNQVDLSWTNPGDGDFAEVVILRDTFFVADRPAEGNTYSAPGTIGSSTIVYVGNLQTFTDTTVSNGATYYYKIFSRDTYSNYAAGVQAGPFVPHSTTTLSDGADPADATVGPGSADNHIDQFTLVTNSAGGSAVSALTVTTATTLAVASVEIWNSSFTTQYFTTVSTPTGNNWNFSGIAIPVTTSPAAFNVRITVKDHASLTPGTFGITANVTSFTASDGPAGTETAGTTLTVDNTPPANPSWGLITSNENQVTLNWTNPADSDFVEVVILRNTISVSDSPTEGSNYSAPGTIGISDIVYVGNLQTFTDTGVTNGTGYYYKIFSRDTYSNYSTGFPSGPHTPAAIAPASSITNPLNGATIGGSAADPYIISGNASDNTAVAGVDVSINGGAWQPATCTGCPGANVTWSYSWTLPADGNYTIQSRGTDAGSNVETPSAGNTVTVDRTGPNVSSTNPADGATGVVTNSSITFNWNEDVDCATVNTVNITIDSGSLNFSSCSNNQTLFTTIGQSGSTSYTVTVSTAVTDAAGNPMAANHVFTYTTSATSDTQSPSSGITAPINGAVINSLSPDPFTITGSAADNIAVSSMEISINGGAWQTAACTGCPGPNVTWSYSWTLPVDGIYIIRSRAIDTSSNVELPTVGNTIIVDRTDPQVSSTTPVDNDTAVPIDSIVTIIWDDTIDCTTVNVLSITSDSPGWAFYSCTGSQAIFTTAGQALSTTYNFNVTTAVTDLSGNSMAVAYGFSYTTADQLGQELSRNPEFNTGAEWNINLENTESGSGFFQHDPSKSQTPDGSGSVQAHEQGQNFTIQGTITQDVYAPAGSTIDNVSIFTEHITTHDTTGDIVDIELRYADPTIPADGEIDVPLNTDVTINFGEPMDCASINTANVTISNGGWALFDCTVDQVTFTTSGQTNNTTYTVTVTTNITDAAGNALVSPFVFSYTTIP